MLHDGAAVSERVFNVDSSTGFLAGEPIVIGDQTTGRTEYRPTRIRKIVSGTQIEVYHGLTVADNQFVNRYYDFAIVPRILRRARDFTGWEMWVTAFKYQDGSPTNSGGEEVMCRFVSDDTNDPALATWSLSTDHGFPWVGLTRRTGFDFAAEENMAFILDVDDIILSLSAPASSVIPILSRQRTHQTHIRM